jgi:hypothetical protein
MPLKFEINIYKELIEKYPTWNDLQQYLESNEGGLFKVCDRDDSQNHCLIKYEKGLTKMNLEHSKWFRSVVWDTKNNRPLCIAPPKSSDIDFPCKTINDINENGIICQEHLDGFMINCFKVKGDNKLYISSRSKLHATGNFYSEKSFKELFIEAYLNTKNIDFNENNVNDIFLNNFNELNNLDISKNQVAIFCSFLVQHTENRIVNPIDSNRVYLVHSGIVFDDNHIEFIDNPIINSELSINNIEFDTIDKNNFSYAQVTNANNEVQRFIKKIFNDKDWKFQGVVFKDNRGNRWKFTSEKYLAVRALRGNSPIIRDRIAQLYTENLINKYLEYYPEETLIISIHLALLDAIVEMLYSDYIKLHIRKNKSIEDINKVFLPHLYRIHGIYLSQLKSNNKSITIDDIKIYLHKQPWQRISFLIKKIIDGVNSD